MEKQSENQVIFFCQVGDQLIPVQLDLPKEVKRDLPKDPSKQLLENIKNTLSTVVSETCVTDYKNWQKGNLARPRNPLLSYSTRMAASECKELRDGWYLKMALNGPKVCDFMVDSAADLMKSISRDTNLVPMNFIEEKDCLCVFDSSTKMLLKTTSNALTAGRFENNILRIPENSSNNDVSRVNTMFIIMKDTQTKKVTMFLIDSWSCVKTALINADGEEFDVSKTTSGNDGRRLMMVDITEKPIKVKFGNSLIYTLSLLSGKTCVKCCYNFSRRGNAYKCGDRLTCNDCTKELTHCPSCSTKL
jgi:hypothetical protein